MAGAGKSSSFADRLRPAIALALVSLAAIGCRNDPEYPKVPAINLDEDDGGAPLQPAPSDFSTEDGLAQRYPVEIVPFFEGGLKGGFQGADDLEVRYRVFRVPSERGAIVLLPERAEPVRKYAEVIQDLTRQGYSVFAIDHRGQGESQRLISNGQVGYVEYFRDYVTDLDTFVKTIVKPAEHPNLFLLGHSMGGGIAVLYLDEHRSDSGVRAVALVSPMIELDVGLDSSFSWTWSAGDCSRTGGNGFAPGESAFDPNAPFDGNQQTHSQVRFDIYHAMLRGRAELQVGGYSNRWLCEAMLATGLMQTVGIYSRMPTLILWASEDEFVSSDGIKQYCDDAAACQRERLKGAYHDILNEKDGFRNEALSKVVRYFRHFQR
jgi:lysophospholipase